MLSNCGLLSTTIACGIPNQQTMFFPNELGDIIVFDVGIDFCLYPFAEIIYGYE